MFYPYDPMVYFLGTLFTIGFLLLYGWLCWTQLTKAGYLGTSRILFMVGMTFFFPFGNIAFSLMPWPLETRSKRLMQRLDEIEKSIRFSPGTGSVDAELNRLRTELGLTKIKKPPQN